MNLSGMFGGRRGVETAPGIMPEVAQENEERSLQTLQAEYEIAAARVLETYRDKSGYGAFGPKPAEAKLTRMFNVMYDWNRAAEALDAAKEHAAAMAAIEQAERAAQRQKRPAAMRWLAHVATLVAFMG